MYKKFDFFVPATIEKSVAKDGKETMVLGGVASTDDIDADEQFMVPGGFDFSELMTTGFVNWNHLAKSNPGAIIGEPIDAKVDGNKFHIKAQLFSHIPTARDAYNLAQALHKAGSKRKLGWSIEGKVMETDPLDPRKVTKAKITGVALTPSPKNPHTFANIMKGHIDHEEYEYEIQKADNNGGEVEYLVDVFTDSYRATVNKSGAIKIEKMDTGDVAPVTKESLEGQKKKKVKNLEYFQKELSKAQAFQYIFENFEVNIEKAKEIYNLFLNVERSINSNFNMEKQTISSDAIQKAREILNLATDIEKGGDSHMSVSEETNGGKETVLQKAIEFAKACMTAGKTKDQYKKEALEKGYDEEIVEKAFTEAGGTEVTKAETETDIQKGKSEETVIGKENDNDIMKAINTLNDSITQRFGAVGTLITGQSQAAEENTKILQKAIDDLEGRLNQVEQVSQGRKSIGNMSFVERFDEQLQKGGMEGKTVLSMSQYADRQKVARTLFQKANNCGDDKGLEGQYMNAITGLESQGILSKAIQEDLLQNDNIMVVK